MAKQLNITAKQGSDFTQEVIVYEENDQTAVNLNSYTIKSEIRKTPSSSLISAISIGGLDPTNGRFLMYLTSAQTAAIPAGRYVYDVIASAFGTIDQVVAIQLGNGGSGYTSIPTVTITGGGGSGATGIAILGGIVERLLEGMFTISQEVTQI